jgi:hypothetical protein
MFQMPDPETNPTDGEQIKSLEEHLEIMHLLADGPKVQCQSTLMSEGKGHAVDFSFHREYFMASI